MGTSQISVENSGTEIQWDFIYFVRNIKNLYVKLFYEQLSVYQTDSDI